MSQFLKKEKKKRKKRKKKRFLSAFWSFTLIIILGIGLSIIIGRIYIFYFLFGNKPEPHLPPQKKIKNQGFIALSYLKDLSTHNNNNNWTGTISYLGLESHTTWPCQLLVAWPGLFCNIKMICPFQPWISHWDISSAGPMTQDEFGHWGLTVMVQICPVRYSNSYSNS